MSDHHTQFQDQERRAALTPVTDDGWSDAANEAADTARPYRASRLASMALARDSRLDTVPSGTPSCSAASLRVLPSRSQRTRTAR